MDFSRTETTANSIAVKPDSRLMQALDVNEVAAEKLQKTISVLTARLSPVLRNLDDTAGDDQHDSPVESQVVNRLRLLNENIHISTDRLQWLLERLDV